jgi:type I restriction enzyme S subunit
MSFVKLTLDDVCDLITCGVAKRPNYVDNGIPFLSARNVKNQKVIWDNYRYISKDAHVELTKNNKPRIGDILYTRVGSYGEAAIVDKNIEFSVFVSLTLIKPNNKIFNKYLTYYLNSPEIKELAKKSISGSGVGNLNVSVVRKFPILLPPLPIQQKIVTKLDKIFAEINNLESILQNKLSQVKMINNIIISSLVEKEKNLKKINLNNICNIKGRIGYRGYTKKDITAKGLGAISLSPSNIIDSKLDFKKTTYVSWKKYEESPEIIINQGDIIFCKTGSTYGKTAYIESLPEKATLNPQLVVLKNIKCNKKYLFYYMMTENFKFQIEEIVGGTAMPTLSQEKLGQTIIKLPSEISQKIIVNKIDKCNKNIEQIFINTKIIINNIHSLKSKALQIQLSL